MQLVYQHLLNIHWCLPICHLVMLALLRNTSFSPERASTFFLAFSPFASVFPSFLPFSYNPLPFCQILLSSSLFSPVFFGLSFHHFTLSSQHKYKPSLNQVTNVNVQPNSLYQSHNIFKWRSSTQRKSSTILNYMSISFKDMPHTYN